MKRNLHMFVVAAILLFVVASSVGAKAETVITANDGNWESVETWAGKVLPKADDVVIIANKVSISQSAEVKYGHVCVLAKASMAVSKSAVLKTYSLMNYGELTNDGTIEIGDCNGEDGKVFVVRETVSAGDWANPSVWNNNKVPAKGEIIVVSHDVKIKDKVAEIPSVLIIQKGATLSVGETASVVANKILNYGNIENEGVIQIEE